MLKLTVDRKDLLTICKALMGATEETAKYPLHGCFLFEVTEPSFVTIYAFNGTEYGSGKVALLGESENGEFVVNAKVMTDYLTAADKAQQVSLELDVNGKLILRSKRGDKKMNTFPTKDFKKFTETPEYSGIDIDASQFLCALERAAGFVITEGITNRVQAQVICTGSKMRAMNSKGIYEEDVESAELRVPEPRLLTVIEFLKAVGQVTVNVGQVKDLYVLSVPEYELSIVYRDTVRGDFLEEFESLQKVAETGVINVEIDKAELEKAFDIVRIGHSGEERISVTVAPATSKAARFTLSIKTSILESEEHVMCNYTGSESRTWILDIDALESTLNAIESQNVSFNFGSKTYKVFEQMIDGARSKVIVNPHYEALKARVTPKIATERVKKTKTDTTPKKVSDEEKAARWAAQKAVDDAKGEEFENFLETMDVKQ